MTQPRLLQSPVFRLILTTSAIFGLSALVMFGVMYAAATRFMERQVDTELQNEIASLADNDGRFDQDRLVARVRGRVARHKRTGVYYLIEDDQGDVLVGNLPAQPVPFDGLYDLPSPTGEAEHVLRSAGAHLGNGMNLMIARDVYPIDEIADLMERTFGIGVLITLTGSLLSGTLVSRRLLQRIDLINRTSREIMRGDLGRRIPIGNGDRDLDQLSVNLNEMLGRIEELLNGVRQISDNIAHDMRTPLTRLRHHLERVRLAGLSVEEFREAIDIALLETDDVLDTFGALLRIAQIEYRTAEQGLSPINLSEVCAMILETYGPVAESEGFDLVGAIVPALRMQGDKRLLTQLLVNLVENSMQHNPPGREIRLLLSASSGGVLLTVADDGAGIPPEERQNVLQRFYRLDASRSGQGSGLGLSMVAAIANYHGARLTLDDNQPGLKVTLEFPV